MPEIKRFGNCAIVIRTREHAPPHFHIIFKDGRECLVIISSFELTTNDRISLKEISEALTWASCNKELILNKWKEITKK